MPSELNKKMDDLLKRFVKKRREEATADFELHSVTRRILQSEVERAFPKSKPKRFAFRFWPGLALVGVFTGLFAVTIFVLNTPRQGERPLQLSQRSDSVASAASLEKINEPENPALGLRTGSAEAAKESLFKSTEPQVFSRKREMADLEATSAITPSRELSDSRLASELPAENRPLSVSRSPTAKPLEKLLTDAPAEDRIAPASVAAPAIASLQPEKYYEDAPSSLRRKFIQQDLRANYRQNLLSPAQPKILQSFEIERVENGIRIHDGDGSVYEGVIIDAESDSERIAGARVPGNSEFTFRVTGTNRPLRQLIIFTGTISDPNTSPNQSTTALFEAKDSALNEAKSKKQSIDSPGSVQGKISIGGTNTFQIQAVEATEP